MKASQIGDLAPSDDGERNLEIPPDWEDPEGLHDLLQFIREIRPEADIRKIRLAYYLAERAHSGQTRASGEPYILHPLKVAQILAELRMDDDTIAAALLHDVLEDTTLLTEATIEQLFGADVMQLVEGVTKLKLKDGLGKSDSKRAAFETARAAESLRKMLLAMARDFRVMVIKLVDRLHNMQTLQALPPDRRTRIANETLDVYAPLAARLGIWQVKWQLEDLAFMNLHPKEFAEVRELVAKSRRERENLLNTAIVNLKERLTIKGLRNAEVTGRPKHLYSIFNKMVKQDFEFGEILDLLAIRIIVETTGECYAALGYVHELWVPIQGLFSDYIAKPKPNGYQSLHTKVIGPGGEPLEVQIRTREMHEVAEFGVAAHWTYKEGETKRSDSKQLVNLRQQLFDWNSDAKTSSEFLRSISTDLFSEQVFAFTPKGDVLDLPSNSTPIDFAFRVHTQIGLTLVGAKVNGILVPLHTKLHNGDVVELVTRNQAQPSLDWLEYVKSSHARNKLRAHFRKLNRSEDAQRGRETLERELKALGLEPREFLGDDKLNALAKSIEGCEDRLDILSKIGNGTLSVQRVLTKMRGTAPDGPKADSIQTSKTREGKLTLTSSGLDNVQIKRAKCCDPLPGDDVVGYVTRGRGMLIHRKLCPNAVRYQTAEPERLMALDWPPDGTPYAVMLKILTVNRQGLLMDISTVFGESQTNVSAAKIKTMPNHTAEIEITIEVPDTDHLTILMTRIGSLSDVISVFRMFGRSATR